MCLIGGELDWDVNATGYKPRPILYFKSNNIVINELSCGRHHIMVLTSNACVFGWGSNLWGQIVCSKINLPFLLRPIEVIFHIDLKIRKILCINETTFAITCEGQVFMWGRMDNHAIKSPQMLYDAIDIKDICFEYYFKNSYIYLLLNDGFLYLYDYHTKYIQKITHFIFSDIKQIFSHISKKTLITGKLKNNNAQIYEIIDKQLIETKYQTFDDYYSREFQITLNTISTHNQQNSQQIFNENTCCGKYFANV